MFSFYLLFFHSVHPWLSAFWCFVLLGKKCPGRRRVEEKDFHSVIQRHRVNASILFLTTSVNCRSDSPTHSTFLLEGDAETLRLKWDEECSKRCCSCPFLTPSPPLISPFFFSTENLCSDASVCRDVQEGVHANTACNKAKTFNKQWQSSWNAIHLSVHCHNIVSLIKWHRVESSRCIIKPLCECLRNGKGRTFGVSEVRATVRHTREKRRSRRLRTCLRRHRVHSFD